MSIPAVVYCIYDRNHEQILFLSMDTIPEQLKIMKIFQSLLLIIFVFGYFSYFAQSPELLPAPVKAVYGKDQVQPLRLNRITYGQPFQGKQGSHQSIS